MIEYFLILPHQLFDKKYLSKKYHYILYEHPHYFNSFNYNKKKLLLHYGSMKYYYDYLKTNNFKVKYIKKDEKFNIDKYKLFDPIDKIELKNDYEKVNSPNFLLSKELVEKYRKKTKSFYFHYFYEWSKKELDIIPNIKSKDKENRLSLPADIKIPNLPENVADEKYINYGKNKVESEFENNYGNVDDFIFPLTHKTAKLFLRNFLKKRFKDFGPYEDAISKDNDYIFHSVLSSSINIGLLNPSEIIEDVLKLKDIPVNSKEGYIRQLFWREYQRYTYLYIDFKSMNYFNFKNKLDKRWYNGTLGNEVIDKTIKKGFDNAYLHHIERLMVIGNYMVLSEISPEEGYKWFMEFPIDSYMWVMSQNVFDMVFFVGGGLTMRRPYISTSNYIVKMSNYKRGEWCDIWDELYYRFLKKYKKKLWKYRYFFRGLKDI